MSAAPHPQRKDKTLFSYTEAGRKPGFFVSPLPLRKWLMVRTLQEAAFSGIFPLTIRAYMLIFRREGKKRMGKGERNHDGMRQNLGWPALRSFGEGGMPGEGGRIGLDGGGEGCHGGGIPHRASNPSILYRLSWPVRKFTNVLSGSSRQG